MKQTKLNVQTRGETGGGPCGRLRKAGLIPAVIYGDSGARNLSVVEPELRKLMRSMHGAATLIELTDDKGHQTLSILKQLSRNSVTDLFVHVDFQEIALNKEMTMSLQVHVVGESFGVRNESGTLELHAHHVNLRCLPKNLPEYIEVDVTELRAGHSIHIRDLKPIDGVTFTDDADVVVAACVGPIAAEAEAPAAEGAPAAKAAAPAKGAPAAKAAAPAPAAKTAKPAKG